MFNILVYDDKPALINGLVSYFSNNKFIRIQESFLNSDELLKSLNTNNPDLALIEINTLEENGIQLISQIYNLNAKIKIVVYTSSNHDFISEDCMKAGATTLVNKTISLKQLEDVLMEVLTKKKDIDTLIWSIPTLTKQEKIIITHLAKGNTARTIANELKVSPNTIHNQKNHLLNKFGCDNSIELIFKLVGYGYMKM